LVDELFGEDLHAKRVLSITLAVTGILQAAHLALHALGRGLAAATGSSAKHGTKQVDRLLSNDGLALWRLGFALSWQSVAKGSSPLTGPSSPRTDMPRLACTWSPTMGERRRGYGKRLKRRCLRANETATSEKEVLGRLHALLPLNVEVTVLADRGFGDQAL
jgi:hypothetical protein